MNLNPKSFTTEITDILATTGENYTTATTNLGVYGTSCEITKHGSDRKLHLTPVDDDLVDMVLYNRAGTTIASGTLFHEAIANITPEEFANLITLCF